MKYISYTILFILCICPALAGGEWKLGPAHPNGVDAANEGYPLYAYGDSLFILSGKGPAWNQYFIKYTTNFGKTWKTLFNGYGPYDDVLGEDTNLDNLVLHYYPPSTLQLSPVSSIPARLFTSSDMGATWSKKFINCGIADSSYIAFGVQGYDTLTQIGYVVPPPPSILNRHFITHDAWKTKHEFTMPEGYRWPTLVNDSIIVSGTGASQMSTKITISSDGGATWSYVVLPNSFGSDCFVHSFTSIPKKNNCF